MFKFFRWMTYLCQDHPTSWSHYQHDTIYKQNIFYSTLRKYESRSDTPLWE